MAILGDMFELGEESLEEHKHIITLLRDESDVKTYFIGKDFYANKIESTHVFFFESFELFSDFVKKKSCKTARF